MALPEIARLEIVAGTVRAQLGGRHKNRDVLHQPRRRFVRLTVAPRLSPGRAADRAHSGPTFVPRLPQPGCGRRSRCPRVDSRPAARGRPSASCHSAGRVVEMKIPGRIQRCRLQCSQRRHSSFDHLSELVVHTKPGDQCITPSEDRGRSLVTLEAQGTGAGLAPWRRTSAPHPSARHLSVDNILTVDIASRHARAKPHHLCFWGIAMLGSDLTFAVRGLTGAPGLSAAAVVALALGIGPNTAIFSIVYATLLAPLPFSEPDQLVRVTPMGRAMPRIGHQRPSISSGKKEPHRSRLWRPSGRAVR